MQTPNSKSSIETTTLSTPTTHNNYQSLSDDQSISEDNTIQSLSQQLVLPPEGYCFHCGDPVPTPPFYATVLGEEREMCCMGCQLAAQSIVEAGLEQYYLDRSEINRTASLPSQLSQLQAYDHEDIKSQFVYAQDGLSVAELSVNNLRCAACTWLIEERLYELEGIERCQVNLTNQRMRVIWDEDKLPISQILATINQIGYEARPYRQDTHEAMLARHNKTMMIRLGIAALGAMQAMMYAVGMYFGDYSGMLVQDRNFLRWVSLFVSIPVFFYAGVPFFASAWSAIKARQVNMDVPVSIALLVTFFASLYATITGHGETYYDSVSMFIFFLLAGRYIEHNARLKAASMANDLVVLEPTLIRKLGNEALWLKTISDTYPHLTDSNLNTNNTTTTLTPNSLNTNTLNANTLNANTLNANTLNTSSLYANKPATISDNESNDRMFSEKGFSDKKSLYSNDTNSLSNNLDASVLNKLKQLSQLSNSSLNKNQPLDQNQSNLNQSQTVDTGTISEPKITAHSLQIGDVIFVEAGCEVVADGILCSETATVSQSLLTGESDLIVKSRGEIIIGGSQNDSQPFVMIVTQLPENSQIGLIDRLMNRAMSEKPKIAEQADKWARWFVARILVLSVLVFAGWYVVDPSHALWATVAVLVATCPCALSLATPIALTVSTNRLATYGFLTTRGHTLQTLGEVTHIAFDKTGTLTYGKPNLLRIDSKLNVIQKDTSIASTIPALFPSSLIAPNDDTSSDPVEDQLLAIAAAMEVGSRHPIAHALLEAAYQLHLPAPSNMKQYPAGGIEAVIDGRTYRLGHYDFALGIDNKDLDDSNSENLYAKNNATDTGPDKLDDNENNRDDFEPLSLSQNKASMAVVLTIKVSHNQNLQGSLNWLPLAYFYFNDKVRPSAAQMITDIKAKGITPIMLTGDPSEQALITANQLGIDNAYNAQSPSQKVEKIQELQDKGAVVMMVGDGINDAPVLAAANVSSAIAGAADLAQVSSDSVILNGAVESVVDALNIADKAKNIIKQNLYWALAYNGIVLLPAAFGYVPPWLAAIGMSFSSLVVVLNALRLKRY